MRTQKAISNIAYHRPEVFGMMTDHLREAGLIGPCFWIAHTGEGGDKPHIHLLLLGGFKVYDTAKLGSAWGVDVIDGKAASVTARWCPVKEGALSDWFLYAVHDPKYLAWKGQAKEVHYPWSDVRCSKGDEEIRDQLIREAQEAQGQQGDRTMRRLICMAQQGRSFEECVLAGMVPMGQLTQARTAWEIVRRHYWKGVRDDTAEI